jgi:hypothetical protein
LTDVLSRAGIRTTAWLVGQLLGHAELRAVICSGVPSGHQQTYALVDERAPKAPSMTRDEMLAALTERYFQSHGPATVKDYQWWSGLRVSDAARGIDMLGGALIRVNASGSGERTYLAMAKRPAWRPATGSAHVIQPFDELVVAYSESRDLVDVSGSARGASADGFALLMRGVVYDGQLVARWRTTPARGSRGIAIEPLRRLSSKEHAAIDAATTRFERFYFRTSRGSH